MPDFSGLERFAESSTAIEVQATYDARNATHRWSANIGTYRHDHPELDAEGSLTGRGHGEGRTLDEAIAVAVSEWAPSSEAEPAPSA